MSAESNYVRYIEAVNGRKRAAKYHTFKGQTNGEIVLCHDIPAEILIKIMDLCPVGDGNLYEHLVLDAIGIILGELVDRKEVLMHGRSQGVYYDTEFAFCTEKLQEYQFWEPWYYQYEIKSIMVEAKNEEKKVSCNAAVQVKGYVNGAKKGNFGMLVSRNGFTKSALKELRSYADDQNTLILPITHRDLKELLRLSMRNAFYVYKFLRIKETLLRRVR